MADYQHHEPKSDEPCEAAPAHVKIEEIDQPVEATDRGLFGLFGKKKDENKCEEDAIASEFDDKVQVCDEKKEEPKFDVYEEKKEEPKFEACEEPKEEEKKHESLLEKLHRNSSSSSSSSDEEVLEGGEKKKKKKGLKDKIKGKITGDKKEAAEETSIPVEKCDEIPTHEPEEKKGFLDKIKEKLPGGKKTEEVSAPPPPHKEEVVECATAPEAEGKEKKGFLDKIKEKLPGYHPKGEEEKEKEKGEEACH